MISSGFLAIIVPQNLRYDIVTFISWSIDSRLPLLNVFCNYTHMLAFRTFFFLCCLRVFSTLFNTLFSNVRAIGFVSFCFLLFPFLVGAAKFREPNFPLKVSLINCDENYTFMWIYLYLFRILLLAKVNLR